MNMENISIVIPVRNEENTVQPLIDSIGLQTRLPDEVVFVDGGSEDNTAQQIKKNIGKTPFKIKLIEADKAYPGEGRNIGIKNSDCDLIAFTDAGIRLHEKWIEELVRPIEEDGSVDVVYGAYEPVIDSFIRECSLMAYCPPKEKRGNEVFRTDVIPSSLFRKKICIEAGLFPPFRAAEDKIFMENVKKMGAKAAYTNKAVIYWQIPGSYKSIFRRFCEFSMHDLLAGRARDWHYSVMRTYGILSVLLFLGIFINKLFLPGIPALAAFRVARMFYKRKSDFKIRYALDPRYLFSILFIVLLTDLALFCGSVKYLLRSHEGNA